MISKIGRRPGQRPHRAIGRCAGRDTLDDSLVEHIAAGDRLAMQVLYTRYNVRVHRFALNIVHDAGAAEDLVHEVFLDVWREAGKFKRHSQVSTWLLAITRHKALSRLRTRTIEALDEDSYGCIEDGAENPEISMQKKQRNSILIACLWKLSPSHREIVDLVYYHEKSIDEVAGIIGVPRNTVKTRMFYARQRLGELLAAEGIGAA